MARGKNNTRVLLTLCGLGILILTLSVVSISLLAGGLGVSSQLTGSHFAFDSGTAFTLRGANLGAQGLTPSLVSQLETLLIDPTVLFILFIVAAICLYLEMSHPGAIVPGAVGALALALFIFGAVPLRPDWGGFVLMLLAIVLLAVDVRAPTHGALTLVALISLVIGSLLFFNGGLANSSGPQDISPIVVIAFALAVGLVAVFVLRFAILAQRRQIKTGKDNFIGQQAQVIEALQPDGRVMIQGENWQARLSPAYAQPDARIAAAAPDGIGSTTLARRTASPVVEVGDIVKVVRVEGLQLIVAPVA